MSIPRYSNYKDGGIDWLGALPEHWEIKPLYAVAIERNEPNRGMIEHNLFSLSYGRIVAKDITSNDGLLPESFETYQVVRPGDIVLRLTDLQNDKRSLRSAIVEQTGIITSAYLAIIPRGADSKYISYLFRAYDTAKVFYSMGGGLRQSMKFCDLKRMPLVLPSQPEQHRIVAFLDQEVGKLNELILEQRRLVELLNEKRQAVISNTVTKGLKSKALLKSSGVGLLGEVPTHWEVGPLKRWWGVTDCKHVTAEFVPDGVPLASIREVQSHWVDLDNAKCTTEHFYNLLIEGGRCPLPGDLIFSRNATIGEVAQVSSNHPRFAMGQDVVLLRKLSPEYSSDYLQYVIRSPVVTQQLADAMIGSTFKRINVDEIRTLMLAFPPPTEQAQIASFLRIETDKFDQFIAEASRAIDLLQERQIALISAAVTGQIDLRELAEERAA